MKTPFSRLSSPVGTLVLFVAALAFVSCGEMMPSDPDLSCTGAGTQTLATVQPLLTMRCGLAGCHDPSAATYGDYSTAAGTTAQVGKKSLYAGMPGTLLVVEPKKLANSALWLKVLGGATKGRTGPKGENVFGAMPQDGTTLDAASQKMIKDWICSGAQ